MTTPESSASEPSRNAGFGAPPGSHPQHPYPQAPGGYPPPPPGYSAPGYSPPGYSAPGYSPPGYQSPGYPNVPICPPPVLGPGQFGLDMYGNPLSDKSKLTAGLLNLLLPFGIGRFYLGYTGIGVAQLLVTIFTCGVGALWSHVDGILILIGNVPDPQGRTLRD